MAYVAVTLQHAHENHDLALPMNVPTRHLIEGITHVLKIPQKRGQSFSFAFEVNSRTRPISLDATLGDAGILHGMTMVLVENKVNEIPLKTGAFLQAASGSKYPMSSKVTLIGRNDPKSGIFVEIDLTSLASDAKAISRRHAQIEQEGDRFYLTDLGSINGTKVNGERIPSKEKKPIWDGDTLEFGRNVVHLTFCMGEKTTDP